MKVTVTRVVIFLN